MNKSLGTLAVLASVGASVGLATSAFADLNFANFNNVSQLKFNGVAAQTNGLPGEQQTISLTPPAGNSAGSVFALSAQPIATGFTTTFQFRMRDRSGSGADGLSFVIQNSTRGTAAIGGRGGALGFATNPYFPSDPAGGIDNGVAIALDTWNNAQNTANPDWADVNASNVLKVFAPKTLGAALVPDSSGQLGSTVIGSAFNDGGIHTVRITYVPGFLQVFYDQFVTPNLTINNFNLSNLLNLGEGGTAFVGFTAATGGVQNSQRQEVLGWTLNNIPSPGAASFMGMGALLAARRRRAR